MQNSPLQKRKEEKWVKDKREIKSYSGYSYLRKQRNMRHSSPLLLLGSKTWRSKRHKAPKRVKEGHLLSFSEMIRGRCDHMLSGAGRAVDAKGKVGVSDALARCHIRDEARAVEWAGRCSSCSPRISFPWLLFFVLSLLVNDTLREAPTIKTISLSLSSPVASRPSLSLTLSSFLLPCPTGHPFSACASTSTWDWQTI